MLSPYATMSGTNQIGYSKRFSLPTKKHLNISEFNSSRGNHDDDLVNIDPQDDEITKFE